MPNLRSNSTSYVHTYEPNTNDLSMAMEYNAGDQPAFRTVPFKLAVVQGKIFGVTNLSIAGYNPSVGTAFAPCWESGVYTYFTTAEFVRVWSDNAADTNVSVLINGPDWNIACECMLKIDREISTAIVEISLIIV